ncbi:hypothetical protein OEZ86_012740 [Tetradesmus obliquus]|nr:hypothetical protein OEZ86_012740 [Tetradesmus obliquus]
MSVAFPKIGDLQVSLLRAPLNSATPDAAVILKKTGTGALGANLAGTGFADAAAAEFPAAAEAAPFTGSFKPAQPLAAFNGKDASGSWVLRVADVPALGSTADASTSPITLTGWALTICFTQEPVPAVAATEGGEDKAPAMDSGNATASGNMTMGGNVTDGGNGTTGKNVSGFDGEGFNHVAMRLLFPWQLPEEEEATVRAASGPLHSVKGAAWGAVHNEVKDFTMLLAAKSAATKSYLNKKLSDHINAVNGASQLMQAAIQGKGSLLHSAGERLMGHIGQLKASIGKGGLRDAAKAEMADKVDNLMKLGGSFMNLAGSVLGDMGSTATLMKDAATAKAKHMVDTYTTTEGVVKAHIDNSVQRRVDALNAMLDHIANTAGQASSVTGPVMDFKLQAHQAKLKALEAALDKLAAMVKATPTPSEVVHGKMAFLSNLASLHPMAKAVSDPEAALAGLMGKMGQFKQALSHPGQGQFRAMMTGNATQSG